MKKNILHKYILSFAFFFIVPMMVLFICLQVILYHNLNKENLIYNQNIMERTGDDLKSVHSRLMEIGNRISFNSPSSNKVNNTQTQLQLIDLLRKENADSMYVTKAYLVYKDVSVCFSSQGVYDKSNFLRRQLRMNENIHEEFFEKIYEIKEPYYDVITKEFYPKEEINSQEQLFREQSASGQRKKQTTLLLYLPIPLDCTPIFTN